MTRQTPYLVVMAFALTAAVGGSSMAQPDRSPVATVPDLLRDQQRVFHAALRRVAPCIVRIDTIGGADPVRDVSDPMRPDVERRAPGFRTADGPTTGVIWSQDGYILTSSFNFVRDPAIITVKLADGRRFAANLIARDQPSRLALLKIDAEGLPTPELLPLEQVRAGQWALVAGYGHGSPAATVSTGIVSARRRMSGVAIQTDAKTSPVNYGGPLFDIEGRLMGIVVPMAQGAGDEIAGVQWYDSGIGFAVHTDHIMARLDRLKAGEALERGVLGVQFRPPPVITEQLPFVPPVGVEIIATRAGAQEAGLRQGDVLTAIAGKPTPDGVAARRVLARFAAGDIVPVEFKRDGRSRTVQVTLTPPPPPVPQTPQLPGMPPADPPAPEN